MLNGKKVVCVIPARLKSVRFPKKILAELKGKPLVQWVWEAAKRIPFFDETTFAIDAQETADVIKKFNGKYVFTSENCTSGTDRLAELLDIVEGDIYVNWQGDEPFIHQHMIDDLLQSAAVDGSDVWTLKKRIYDKELIESPHVCKVVTDHQGYALYFSRALIPFYRDPISEESKAYFKHIGIYAFSKEGLIKISKLKQCAIEEAEKLEQLRFLYNGLKIKVHETQYEVIGIDLPEHLAKAEVILNNIINYSA